MLFFVNYNLWKFVTYTVITYCHMIFYNKMVMCSVSDQLLSLTFEKGKKKYSTELKEQKSICN